MSTQQSLPVTLYLLSYDTERQKLIERSKLGYVVRGAALTELTLRNQLTDEGGHAKITNPARTGDAVLDAVVADIAEDKPRKWKAWVQRQHSQTLRLLEEDLEARRVIAVEHGTVLGLFPKRRISMDTVEVQRLHAMVDEVLRGQRPVGDVDPMQAAAVSLAAAGSMRLVVSGKDKRAYKARIAELTDRSGVAVPALRKVLADIQAATAGAAAAAAAAGASGGGG